MKALLSFFFLIVTVSNTIAQVDYKVYDSNILGESRELKIQTPRSYNDSKSTKYPLIIVLDGDYLFEPVAGNVDYYSYWDDIPEAIVVGVNQSKNREADVMFSQQNSLPMETGAKFFEFIGAELLPYLKNNYRTENFQVAIGHGKTANFINYYLLKDQPIFNAYITISPDLAPDMKSYLTERLPNVQAKTFYYLATSTNDVKSIKNETEALHNSLNAISNNNFLYNYKIFDEPSHYTLPAHVIPKALESIFLVYQPISKKEYTETLLKLETSPVDYLIEKYQTIENLFGIKKQILVNDFKAVEATINKTEKFNYFEDLGKLARKEYPDTMLGSYYLARFNEETGNPKKAMKLYQSAYVLEEIAGLTKDFVLEKAANIKADFGF